MDAQCPSYTLEQILLNPLNNSKSKFQYTFSKAERFTGDKNILKTRQYKYYDLPSMKANIAVGFSRSPRNPFPCRSLNPPPNKYSYQVDGQILDKQIQNGTHIQKGNKFGYGREQAKNDFFIKINQNPGPGEYNPNPELNFHSPIQNLIPKASRMVHSRLSQQTPSPAYYQNIKLGLSNTNKQLSNDKRPKCPIMKQRTNCSRKIKTQSSKVLYNPRMTSNGTSLDNFTDTNRGYSIGKSKRSNFVDSSNNPGPGSYKKFSEFLPFKKK